MLWSHYFWNATDRPEQTQPSSEKATDKASTSCSLIGEKKTEKKKTWNHKTRLYCLHQQLWRPLPLTHPLWSTSNLETTRVHPRVLRPRAHPRYPLHLDPLQHFTDLPLPLLWIIVGHSKPVSIPERSQCNLSLKERLTLRQESKTRFLFIV